MGRMNLRKYAGREDGSTSRLVFSIILAVIVMCVCGVFSIMFATKMHALDTEAEDMDNSMTHIHDAISQKYNVSHVSEFFPYANPVGCKKQNKGSRSLYPREEVSAPSA